MMVSLTAVVGPEPGPGHGECFVWEREDGLVVAVDAGGAAYVGKYAGQRYSPKILVLSHDDSDHIRGAVSLINAAKDSLEELWVPADWVILINQIAKTHPEYLSRDDVTKVHSYEVESLISRQLFEIYEPPRGDVEPPIARRIFETSEAPRYEAQPPITSQPFETREPPREERLSDELLSQADWNLNAWEAPSIDPDQRFIPAEPWGHEHPLRDMTDIGKMIKRVRSRAKPLIKTLSTALRHGVKIRTFSTDLALNFRPASWRTAGIPGSVTLANAGEVPNPLNIQIPAGLSYALALAQLSVQNRRALCTLLWRHPDCPCGGAIIWSDTDGEWLNFIGPRGFNDVIHELRASSAPHHGSAISAHDRVWSELRTARSDLVVISAGGRSNQKYHPDYLALGNRRCCTWCRTSTRNYQEVTAASTHGRRMILRNSCLGVH